MSAEEPPQAWTELRRDRNPVWAEVQEWRDRNPAGTGEDLTAAIGHSYDPDYGVVLRAVLFSVDRHRARLVRFRDEHPDVVIGDAGFGAQQ